MNEVEDSIQTLERASYTQGSLEMKRAVVEWLKEYMYHTITPKLIRKAEEEL